MKLFSHRETWQQSPNIGQARLKTATETDWHALRTNSAQPAIARKNQHDHLSYSPIHRTHHPATTDDRSNNHARKNARQRHWSYGPPLEAIRSLHECQAPRPTLRDAHPGAPRQNATVDWATVSQATVSHRPLPSSKDHKTREPQQAWRASTHLGNRKQGRWEEGRVR